MKRFAVLTLCLSALACDSSDDGTDEAADTAAETTGPACGEEFVEKDGTTPTIMATWGSPCMADADCVPGLGDGATCINNILGVYDLPGGYCTRECTVGSTDITFVLDSPDCDPNGGVACVGIDGAFTACAPVCSSDSQCGRDGYACTIMPNIGAEGDPTFCLMNAESCCSTPGTCS